jgi:hypothetical protein
MVMEGSSVMAGDFGEAALTTGVTRASEAAAKIEIRRRRKTEGCGMTSP